MMVVTDLDPLFPLYEGSNNVLDAMASFIVFARCSQEVEEEERGTPT